MDVLRNIVYAFVGYCLFLFPLSVKGNTDSLLQILDRTLDNRAIYFEEKRAEINALQSKLLQTEDLPGQFQVVLALCKEYESFNFDTAYIYSKELVHLAKIIEEPESLAQSRIQQAFSLLSAGLFREALDSLNLLELTRVSNLTLAEYYSTKSRCYLDIARFYDDNEFSPVYFDRGVALLDSAIYYSREDRLAYLAQQANRSLTVGELDKALNFFIDLTTDPDLPSRELARESAGLGLTYQALGKEQQALRHLLISAIADEQNCVKENTALMLVAQMLHQRGDYERSDRYIDLALADANFYNARLRKFQILNVLPLIKARQVLLSEQKQQQLLIFIVILAVFLLICLALIYNNIKKNQALRHKEQKLTSAYTALEEYTNALFEADKIKEHYIGHFFQRNTKFIKFADRLFKNTRKALGEQKFSDAQYHIKQFSGRREQKKLLQEFDKVFLTIFPKFVEQFNGLFPAEHHYQAPEGELSDPELRIFALIRLGVKNNETIARALDYSVNTIYTYKTKVRKRSLLSNDEFDRAVMNISGLKAENI